MLSVYVVGFLCEAGSVADIFGDGEIRYFGGPNTMSANIPEFQPRLKTQLRNDGRYIAGVLDPCAKLELRNRPKKGSHTILVCRPLY